MLQVPKREQARTREGPGHKEAQGSCEKSYTPDMTDAPEPNNAPSLGRSTS